MKSFGRNYLLALLLFAFGFVSVAGMFGAAKAAAENNVDATGGSGIMPPKPVFSGDAFDVRANGMSADTLKHYVEFNGDVRATMGEMVMRCDTLTVHYTQKAKDGDGDAGDNTAMLGAGSSISKAIASGNVVLSQGDSVAKSQSAVVDMAKSQVTLSGNPIVYQGERVLKGEKILYNLKTQRFEAIGGQGGVQLKFGMNGPEKKDDGRTGSEDASSETAKSEENGAK